MRNGSLAKLKPKLNRIIVFSVAMFLFAGAFAISVLGVDVITSETTKTDAGTGAITVYQTVIPDDVYTVLNTYNGKALDVYNLSYDKKGRAYIAAPSDSEDAQDIKIVRQQNGTYCLYPQSENGLYMLCYDNDAAGGSYLSKTKTQGSNTQFNIIDQGDGTFIISPVFTGGKTLVLSISNNKSVYGYNYVELRTPRGAEDEYWEFSGGLPASLTLGKKYDRVKIYSINQINAVVTPSNLASQIKYTTSDPNVILIDEKGEYCAVSKGKATVTVSCASMVAYCEIEVSEEDSFTWYSQHNVSTGGWNGEVLSKISFNAGGVYKRFIIDKYGRGIDWMDEGCALTSVAMVLRNLDARLTEGYDFRTKQNGNLEADPYTTALANSYNTGSLTGSGTLYNNPIYINARLIASRFNIGGKNLEAVLQYTVNKKIIKEKLDEHPEGVIVCLSNSYNGTHYIVINKCINPD